MNQVGIEEPYTSPLFKRCRGREGALAFFQQCLDADNSEAFFQQGMVSSVVTAFNRRIWLPDDILKFATDTNSNHIKCCLLFGLNNQAAYFGEGNLEQGVNNLERAAKLGHKVAAYAVGLIHVCCGPVDKQHEGMDLIHCVKACTGARIFSVRLRLHQFQRFINWHQLAKWHRPNCRRKPIGCARACIYLHGRCPRRCPWKAPAYLTEDNDDILECVACSAEYESDFFRSLFRWLMCNEKYLLSVNA